MMQAINDKVTFPNSEREWEEGASGRTIVQFVVNADGTMGDIKIVRSCGFSDLDEIAIDALKNALTEKWEPGTVDGKPVAVWYTLPIGFKSK